MQTFTILRSHSGGFYHSYNYHIVIHKPGDLSFKSCTQADLNRSWDHQKGAIQDLLDGKDSNNMRDPDKNPQAAWDDIIAGRHLCDELRIIARSGESSSETDGPIPFNRNALHYVNGKILFEILSNP